MTWDSELEELMPDTVVLTTRTSKNRYGVPTWSTSSSTHQARVVVRQREVRLPTGQTVMSAATVWVASTGTISAEDRLRLPAGVLPSTAPPILSVESFPDQDGTHHHRVTLGF